MFGLGTLQRSGVLGGGYHTLTAIPPETRAIHRR
jgi:hypothetical protein